MSVYDYTDILRLKVKGLTREQHMMGDIPQEYRIVELKSDSNPSGLLIYGRFGDSWHANPSCRYLVKMLVDKLARMAR